MELERLPLWNWKGYQLLENSLALVEYVNMFTKYDILALVSLSGI